MSATLEGPPWHPMTDPVDIKHLGKLGEETGELASAVSRCLIQGLMERDPGNNRLNVNWLEQEIADVRANIELVISRFGLDEERIQARVEEKKERLRLWHEGA